MLKKSRQPHSVSDIEWLFNNVYIMIQSTETQLALALATSNVTYLLFCLQCWYLPIHMPATVANNRNNPQQGVPAWWHIKAANDTVCSVTCPLYSIFFDTSEWPACCNVKEAKEEGFGNAQEQISMATSNKPKFSKMQIHSTKNAETKVNLQIQRHDRANQADTCRTAAAVWGSHNVHWRH